MSLTGRSIVIDCRWLGLGGAGRVTELLLRGLRELAPRGQWLLWGGAQLEGYVWSGATVVHARHPPTAMLGQRSTFSLPAHDLVVYMHQIRPLLTGPCATVILDTIPIRYGGSRITRMLKKRFLRQIARSSRLILTFSLFSRECIERDLKVAPSKIIFLKIPFDTEFRDRVAHVREREERRNVAFYVGRFSSHKNVQHLAVAFSRSRFAHEGGVLRLVGGSSKEVTQLEAFIRRRGIRQVNVEGPCPQSELEELYATSRLLIQPSLEEGFGLPVWDAMCCGLPFCTSDGGSLPEIAGEHGYVFPARSVNEMVRGIDAVTTDDYKAMQVTKAVSTKEFASSFVEALGTHLSNQPPHPE